MIKQLTQLEHKNGERIYHLTCDPMSPTGEIKEALYIFLGIVNLIEKQNAEAAQQRTPTVETAEAPTEQKAE